MKNEWMKLDEVTKVKKEKKLENGEKSKTWNAKKKTAVMVLITLVQMVLLGYQIDAQALDLLSLRRHQVPVEFGRAALAGEGCRYGDLEVEQLENGYVLIILSTGDFKVKQGDSSRSIARERCTWAMPVELESFFSLKIEGVYFEGKARLGSGDIGTINSETFFSGTVGEKISINLDFFNDGKIQEFHPLNLQTACGESLNLRQNNSIVLRSIDSYGNSMIKISDLLILAKVESCE